MSLVIRAVQLDVSDLHVLTVHCASRCMQELLTLHSNYPQICDFHQQVLWDQHTTTQSFFFFNLPSFLPPYSFSPLPSSHFINHIPSTSLLSFILFTLNIVSPSNISVSFHYISLVFNYFLFVLFPSWFFHVRVLKCVLSCMLPRFSGKNREKWLRERKSVVIILFPTVFWFLHWFRYLNIYSLSLSSFISFHFFSSPSRFSSVNEVLIFNDSLIVLTPSSPIWLSTHLSFLFILFSLVLHFLFITSQIQFRQCCVNL